MDASRRLRAAVVRTSAGERVEVDDQGRTEIAGAALFATVWDALVEVLGTAAVAAIVRRAVARTASDNPELVDLIIIRKNLQYQYTLPPAWSQKTARGPVALQALAAQIGRILVELTGTVVIRRLEQIPVLRARGLLWRAEESN
jgi:hypothetical protein